MIIRGLGGQRIHTHILARARVTNPAWVWMSAAVAIPLMLVLPALWNGYPLLQYDTGGYLARWYEGYLVPSRSTVFGLYLHYGQGSSFWINLGVQALATLWIVQLSLRVFGMLRPWPLTAISVALILSTALPWLASTLLTDIFTGLSVLALFILVVHGRRISGIEKCSLFAFTAFAAATHSATLAVLLGLCCAGWIARPFSARPDRRFRIAAGQPDHCCRRRHAAIRQLCPVGTAGMDTRRLRRCVWPDAAGRHRQAISRGSLPAAETEALSLPQ
jgi:hypothetical protein